MWGNKKVLNDGEIGKERQRGQVFILDRNLGTFVYKFPNVEVKEDNRIGEQEAERQGLRGYRFEAIKQKIRR